MGGCARTRRVEEVLLLRLARTRGAAAADADARSCGAVGGVGGAVVTRGVAGGGQVVQAPAILLLRLTVPTVDKDRPNGGWCRAALCIQVPCCPRRCLTGLGGQLLPASSACGSKPRNRLPVLLMIFQ